MSPPVFAIKLPRMMDAEAASVPVRHQPGHKLYWRRSEGLPSAKELRAAARAVVVRCREWTTQQDSLNGRTSDNEWMDDYIDDDGATYDGHELMVPLVQQFIQSFCLQQRTRLVAWIKHFRGRWRDMCRTNLSPPAMPELSEFQTGSKSLARGSKRFTSLDHTASEPADPETDEEAFRRFVRCVFTDPLGPAVNLPVGVVLFEGRGLESVYDARTMTVGTMFTRTRVTSTSWHPVPAFEFMPTRKSNAAAVLDIFSRNEAEQSILFVHCIASPNVLGVSVTDAQRISASRDWTSFGAEREIILRPFLNFHVVRDQWVLLPDYSSRPVFIRALGTHVYVEDECPLCHPTPAPATGSQETSEQALKKQRTAARMKLLAQQCCSRC